MNKLYNSFAFLSKNSYYLCFGTKSCTQVCNNMTLLSRKSG